jgi:tRNA 2-thiouridine synthesizing protein E
LLLGDSPERATAAPQGGEAEQASIAVTRRIIAGYPVDMCEGGFMLNPDQWNEEIAVEIAREVGIDPLTEDHWKIIRVAREDHSARGETPGLRRIGKLTGVTPKVMYQLFPKGPGVLLAQISGLPRPKGCT